MSKQILVTGAGGFIGSHCVDLLIENGYEVICYDKYYTYKNPLAINIEGSLDTEYNGLETIFSTFTIDSVLHFAGIVGTSETWDIVEQTVNVNILGSIKLYKLCAQYKTPVILADAGNKWLSPYTITKQCASQFAQAYGNKYNFPVISLSLCNVYGPRQSTKIIKIIPNFIKLSLLDQDITVFGNHFVDLIHVKDVAKAFLCAIQNPEKFNLVENIYVGTGITATTYEIALYISTLVGKGRVVRQPARIGEERIEPVYMKTNLLNELTGDWVPTIDYKTGIKDTLDWYMKNEFTA